MTPITDDRWWNGFQYGEEEGSPSSLGFLLTTFKRIRTGGTELTDSGANINIVSS